jgi:hypothetical protein
MYCLTYTRTPKDYRIQLSDSITVTNSVTRPVTYLIPPEYSSLVVDLLLRHGVRVERAVEPFQAEVEVYHVEELSFRETPYQGHLLASAEVTTATKRSMDFPAGTYLVPMDQTASEIAALLLEPESRDGLLAWNRMNNLTTDPKVGEEWVLANLGRRMMEDPVIAEAFHQRAEMEPGFLEDDSAKADFFWNHSPYPTPGVGDYPISRVLAQPTVATEIITGDNR